jgi:hypothetical protein
MKYSKSFFEQNEFNNKKILTSSIFLETKEPKCSNASSSFGSK